VKESVFDADAALSPSESRYGTFSVGDTTTSTNSFKQQSSNNPVEISSENKITVHEGVVVYEEAVGYSVPAAFPQRVVPPVRVSRLHVTSAATADPFSQQS
jgi:hypothetical protein